MFVKNTAIYTVYISTTNCSLTVYGNYYKT